MTSNSYKGCQMSSSVDGAKQTCSTMGARLCHMSELEAWEGYGGGCGMNGKPVWSSDPCTMSDGEPGYMTGKGGSGKTPACKAESSGKAGVLCCADTC
eukprot:scaffold123787_cov41-Prasinocladus_malaysianus.AAC.1